MGHYPKHFPKHTKSKQVKQKVDDFVIPPSVYKSAKIKATTGGLWSSSPSS